MREARECVEVLQARFEAQDESLSETTISEILLGVTAELVRYVKFNQNEEGAGIGADWIWWWIDELTGEAFGAIVQAKRLKKSKHGWIIDFRYKAGMQRQDLLATADLFSVVPLYALYLGTNDYRAGAFCRAVTHAHECLLCRMSTLAAVPALLTTAGGGGERDEVAMAMTHHMSLEELVSPDLNPASLWNIDLSEATDDFKTFMTAPQAGSRAIAKNILRRIVDVRSGAFSGRESALMTLESTAVFPGIPADRGHFGLPYMHHVLRGLLTEAPDYVQAFTETGKFPSEFEGLLAGMAVFSIPVEHRRTDGADAADLR